jgi:3-hydroxyacyl-CoA dehydrogenase/enoyl-CoA hydratase/3-hydroxybutyryl-CoA epimerase
MVRSKAEMRLGFRSAPLFQAIHKRFPDFLGKAVDAAWNMKEEGANDEQILSAVRAVLQERVLKKQVTRHQMEDQFVLVGGTTDYSGFGAVDLVIEAVFEDTALKHRVLQEVEPAIAADAVYASNTSTIPIATIAAAAERPERVLGMHFFSPVHKMPLLEVIVTPATTPAATVTAVAYGKKLGKTVIVVNDGPGFYTTRTLSAYMNEAGHLLDEGAPIEAVDRALVDFGFPVGPITLLDEVGIDVGAKVGKILHEAFGERIDRCIGMKMGFSGTRWLLPRADLTLP